MKRQILAIFAAMLIAGAWVGAAIKTADAADDGKQYAGTWKGTWEGGGASGRFDLTLAHDGSWSGGVSVGQDTGDYTAKFTTVTVADNKLSAKYDYPPDFQA